MSVGTTEIGIYVESIWNSVLGLETHPGPSGVLPESKAGYLTGCVQITGGWEGAVTLDIPLGLARQAAAIMFMAKSPAEVSMEQIHDTVGELTNMIGGNLKALLTGPCFLTLPSVADGQDYTFRVLGSKVSTQASFTALQEHFVITLIERNPSAKRGLAEPV